MHGCTLTAIFWVGDRTTTLTHSYAPDMNSQPMKTNSIGETTIRSVPEGTARTWLPCRAKNEQHPPTIPYPTSNPVSVPKAGLCLVGIGGNAMKRLLGWFAVFSFMVCASAAFAAGPAWPSRDKVFVGFSQADLKSTWRSVENDDMKAEAAKRG